MMRPTMYCDLFSERGLASSLPISVATYPATYPESTKNAPTTTLICVARAKMVGSLVAQAMKWPVAMYAMRKKRTESRPGRRGFGAGFAGAGAGAGVSAARVLRETRPGAREPNDTVCLTGKGISPALEREMDERRSACMRAPGARIAAPA
eukprot:1196240-Prorocentrum_minimum.AAC.5